MDNSTANIEITLNMDDDEIVMSDEDLEGDVGSNFDIDEEEFPKEWTVVDDADDEYQEISDGENKSAISENSKTSENKEEKTSYDDSVSDNRERLCGKGKETKNYNLTELADQKSIGEDKKLDSQTNKSEEGNRSRSCDRKSNSESRDCRSYSSSPSILGRQLISKTIDDKRNQFKDSNKKDTADEKPPKSDHSVEKSVSKSASSVSNQSELKDTENSIGLKKTVDKKLEKEDDKRSDKKPKIKSDEKDESKSDKKDKIKSDVNDKYTDVNQQIKKDVKKEQISADEKNKPMSTMSINYLLPKAADTLDEKLNPFSNVRQSTRCRLVTGGADGPPDIFPFNKQKPLIWSMRVYPLFGKDLVLKEMEKIVSVAVNIGVFFLSSEDMPKSGDMSLMFYQHNDMKSVLSDIYHMELSAEEITVFVSRRKDNDAFETGELKLDLNHSKQLNTSLAFWLGQKGEGKPENRSVKVQNIPEGTSKKMMEVLFPISSNITFSQLNKGETTGSAYIELQTVENARQLIACYKELKLGNNKLTLTFTGKAEEEKNENKSDSKLNPQRSNSEYKIIAKNESKSDKKNSSHTDTEKRVDSPRIDKLSGNNRPYTGRKRDQIQQLCEQSRQFLKSQEMIEDLGSKVIQKHQQEREQMNRAKQQEKAVKGNPNEQYLKMPKNRMKSYAGQGNINSSEMVDRDRFPILPEGLALGEKQRMMVVERQKQQLQRQMEQGPDNAWKQFQKPLSKPGFLGNIPHSRINERDAWSEERNPVSSYSHDEGDMQGFDESLDHSQRLNEEFPDHQQMFRRIMKDDHMDQLEQMKFLMETQDSEPHFNRPHLHDDDKSPNPRHTMEKSPLMDSYSSEHRSQQFGILPDPMQNLQNHYLHLLPSPSVSQENIKQNQDDSMWRDKNQTEHEIVSHKISDLDQPRKRSRSQFDVPKQDMSDTEILGARDEMLVHDRYNRERIGGNRMERKIFEDTRPERERLLRNRDMTRFNLPGSNTKGQKVPSMGNFRSGDQFQENTDVEKEIRDFKEISCGIDEGPGLFGNVTEYGHGSAPHKRPHQSEQPNPVPTKRALTHRHDNTLDRFHEGYGAQGRHFGPQTSFPKPLQDIMVTPSADIIEYGKQQQFSRGPNKVPTSSPKNPPYEHPQTQHLQQIMQQQMMQATGRFLQKGNTR